MSQQIIATDGVKNVNLLTSNDPDVWSGLQGMSGRERDVYYGRVAAAFRAFNLKANTVGNMPFCLYKSSPKGDKVKATNIRAIDEGYAAGDEVDNSATWQNVVKFLPNPSELLRLNTLSYMMTNTIYVLRTSDVSGRQSRGMYHAMPDSFIPWANATNTDIDYIERHVGSQIEKYTYPLDKRLVRMWRLDHTTELLPSKNTEALAIMEAAGIMFYKDFWIKNFFRRGGIRPTLISVQGLIDRDAKEVKEKSWSDWLKGIGRAAGNIARIINGEKMDAKPIGDGIAEMKNNGVNADALADIAMGTGMPLSLLMANSANYATAKEEKATWYENDIIPLCNWFAYEYNRQVFEPMGLRMEFHPETLDPQQEDETQRAAAINQFIAFLNACPTYDVFIGTTETFGYELSDSLVKAAEAFYQDKEKKQEEMAAQMGSAGVVVGPDGKPIPVQADGEEKPEDEKQEEEEEEKKPSPFPAKKTWTPTPAELEESRVYYEVALRRHKKGEPLDFEYKPHHGGLPDDYMAQIKAKLLTATTPEDVREAFVVVETMTPAPEYKSETVTLTVEPDPAILALAEAMNNLANSMPAQEYKRVETMTPNVNITMPAISLTAQMPEQGTVIVNVPEQPAPIVHVTNEVNPTPIEVKNDVTVRPATVNVIEKGKRVAKVKRDRDGNITEITADDK